MIIMEKKESCDDFPKENSTFSHDFPLENSTMKDSNDFSMKNSNCDIIGNMEQPIKDLPNISNKKKSLNPKGLPESAQHRNRLGKAFIARMRADFQKHGIATIERLREKNPGHYLQLIANLIPNQVELNVNHTFMDLLREASEYHNNRNIIDVEVIPEEDSND